MITIPIEDLGVHPVHARRRRAAAGHGPRRRHPRRHPRRAPHRLRHRRRVADAAAARVRVDVRRRRAVRDAGARHPRWTGGGRRHDLGVHRFGDRLRAVHRPPPVPRRDAVLDSTTSSASAASVAVAIPAGRFGTVYVKAEGQTHEFSATAAPTSPAARPSPSRRPRAPGSSSRRSRAATARTA